MSRIIFKGGPWSNGEDEMLKAALSKYGMQNWDQVASFLGQRKTAQQCKDRWQLFLDPAVNRGEWSVDEEESLIKLHDAFPAQWELVASQIPGRRSWQCEEHYHALIESAGGSSSVAPDALIAELRTKRMQSGGQASSSFRAGFDSRFETRAPRADTTDLDRRDEEHRATAFARLGNQDGKKESRESRRQQLELTTFQTTLQRAREMEESGTMSERMKRQREAAMEQTKRRRTDGDDSAEDDEDETFVPVEVEQTAARRKKKEKLVAAAGTAADHTSDVKRNESAIDVTSLFGDGTGEKDVNGNAPPLLQPSLFSWDSLPGERVPRAQRSKVRMDPPAVVTRSSASVVHVDPSKPDATAPAMAVPPGLPTDDRISPAAYAAAVTLIAQEAASSSVRLSEDLTHAKKLIEDAMGGDKRQATTDTPPMPKTTICAPEEALRDVRLALAAFREKAIGSQVGDGDDDHRVADARMELSSLASRCVELRQALYFYESVCLPAEQQEVSFRLARAR